MEQHELSDFDINFLDLATREKIDRVSLTQDNQVVAIIGEDLVTVTNVASLLAKNWLPFSYDKTPSDLHYCKPGGSGWIFEDIDSEIVAKLRIQPQIKHVFIIESSESFTRLAWDKLLKILEDPITDACFILCFAEVDNLPDTIKGRINEFIEIDSLKAKIHVDYLIACGFTPLNAKAGWDGGKGIPSLALELCKNYENAVKVGKFWDASNTLKLNSHLWDKLVQSSLIWEGKASLEKNELDKNGAKLGKILFKKWLNYYEDFVINDLTSALVTNSFGKDLIVAESLLNLINKVKKMVTLNVSLQYIVLYFIYKNNKIVKDLQKLEIKEGG